MNILPALSRMFFTLFVCAAYFCGLVLPVKALTIVPTFDSTISSDPVAGPLMEAAINAAINVFETNYSDNFTVNMTFQVDLTVGLAQSSTSYYYVNYSDFRNALVNNAKSANDLLALSQLPNTVNEPVTGQSQMLITVALANHLGLVGVSPDGSTISFNTNIISFTRPTPNSLNAYDLQSAIEHEIDEVLGGGGAGCNLNAFSFIGATDLFRYATNSPTPTLSRSWTTGNGDNAFFSVDGTNIWARFNTDPGGDLGDFWGFAQDPNTYLPIYWSPPGVFPHAEVQDAFGTPGYFSYASNYYPTTNGYHEVTSPDLGTNELTMLDVIGWTLITHAPPPRLAVALSGAHQITLSWPTNDTGFTLQERTNLQSGAWISSATGATNPAVITEGTTPKYYHLYQAAAPAIAQARVLTAPGLNNTNGPVLRTLKGWQPGIF